MQNYDLYAARVAGTGGAGPVGRGDFGDLAVGHRGEAGEDVSEVGEGIKPAAATALDDGVEDGAAPSLP